MTMPLETIYENNSRICSLHPVMCPHGPELYPAAVSHHVRPCLVLVPDIVFVELSHWNRINLWVLDGLQYVRSAIPQMY
jgi:hypothetical protein